MLYVVEFVYFFRLWLCACNKGLPEKTAPSWFHELTDRRETLLARIPSHAVSRNPEHHLAKTQRAVTLSWKDSLVDPENCTKQLDEVAIQDQQELVAFQQCRYN